MFVIDMANHKDTLFILGAGVSVDHLYPTGVQLLEDIVNILDDLIPILFLPVKLKNQRILGNKQILNKQILAILLSLNEIHLNPDLSDTNIVKNYFELIDVFAKKLKFSTPRSIDDFIHAQVSAELDPAQKERIKKLGKLLIVMRILHYEKKSTQYNYTSNPQDPAYMRVFPNELNGTVYKQVSTFFTEFWQNVYGNSFHDFIKNLNKVRFITFNYDRLLEHFLYDTAKNFFSPSERELASLKSALSKNIIHVYGRLGFLPWENDAKNDAKNEYGAVTFECLRDFMRDILEKKSTPDFYRQGDGSEYRKTPAFSHEVYKDMRNLIKNNNSKYNYDTLFFVFESMSKIRTYTEYDEQSHETQFPETFEHLYFLGFSFHSLNLKAISRIVDLNDSTQSPVVEACVFGMKAAEIEKAEKKLDPFFPKRRRPEISEKRRIGQNKELKMGLNIPDFFKSISGVRYIK